MAERVGVPSLVLNDIVPGNRPARNFSVAKHGLSGTLAADEALPAVCAGCEQAKVPVQEVKTRQP